MSSETHDPALGAPRSDASPPGPLGSGDSLAIERGNDPAIALPPYSSSSGDELNALLAESITQPAPDPFLGAFTTEPEKRPAAEAESPADPAAPSAPTPSSSSTPSEASLAVESESPRLDPELLEFPPDLDAPKDEETSTEPDPAGSFDALSALASLTDPTPAEPALEFPAPLTTEAVEPFLAKAKVGDSEPDDEEEEEEDGELPHRGRSWPTLLLFSYASAVTLGLLWVLFSGRKLREGEEPDLFPASENRLDPGRRADQSRKWVPPQPIAADHLATLGQLIRIGSLEVTPLEIASGSVELEQAFNERAHRRGGSGVLKLKLKLKNISTDAIFVPLDEAFIRDRDRGGPDSFIETAKGGPIAMYPLAVESEWSIRGQSFKELQPGEAVEALLVSAPEASDHLSPPMTWRVRLRTGIDRTDTLGVRFRPEEIRPGS